MRCRRWCFNPRTREGYDVPLLVESNPGQNFNPRTYEGYDMKAEERPYLICALIPVPMKGTIPERLVSGFKVDSL